MAKKKKNTVERKQLLFRYRIDENGKVSFINPCCDELPAMLFCKVMEAISIVEKEWNDKIIPKPPLKYDIMNKEGCPYENSLSCILSVGGRCGLCGRND